MDRIDFTIRLYKDEVNNPYLSEFGEITISGITLVSKPQKFGGVCLHKGNQKKFGYSMEFSRNFLKVAGSHSSPVLDFKGPFIDIKVKNFPRYPAFYQDKYASRSMELGYGYTNFMNDGFPKQLLYRKIEITLDR